MYSIVLYYVKYVINMIDRKINDASYLYFLSIWHDNA